uniref:Uncharacterized protein n=1 Tax=Lactuca sativa TaxID=4236 RepID=A0A9R1UEQ8_LACSA|nr:hypothetical protein LSAT_V11C900457420 [Lactuca sativa]
MLTNNSLNRCSASSPSYQYYATLSLTDPRKSTKSMLVKVNLPGQPYSPSLSTDSPSSYAQSPSIRDSTRRVYTRLTDSSLNSKDQDYTIDFLGGGFNEDVVVASGFSDHEFKMAHLVGRIFVDLATGGKATAEQLRRHQTF